MGRAVKSRLHPSFVKQFDKLPRNVRTLVQKNYQLCRENHHHPGLEFKRIHATLPIYSVRVGIHHRAVGLRRDEGDDDAIVWFFIGSHAEHDHVIAQL